MIVNLKLIRHGKTQASVDGIYCGSTDLSLCDIGIKEILEYKECGLYSERIDAYFTSGMKRANETLGKIYGEVEYQIIPNLKEMCFGDFEMQKHDELLNNPEYIKWIEDISGKFVCPGGESTNGFYSRVKDGFYELFHHMENSCIKNAAVVAHGGTISYFARLFLDENLTFYDAMPQQAKGYNTVLGIDHNSIKVIKWEKF